MGSRGMSDWQGLLVGSVAHKVVHLSSVPVLIVRQSEGRSASRNV
jgi:nucleotide-binding universal stress UspA family protein